MSFSLLGTLIEKKRNEMVASALKYGLNAKKTLHLSQQLDRLLNVHDSERIMNEKRHLNHVNAFHSSSILR